MQGTSQAEQVFKPGEMAPQSGVYIVRHHEHRANHSATIFKGEHFPGCARCGEQVRFVLSRRAARILEDTDFQQASGKVD